MTDHKSIFSEIRDTEESIQVFHHRIDAIERHLRKNYLDDEERQKLENELEDIKVFLSKNEKDLKGLRKENRRSFAVSAFLILVIFLLYSLYVVVFGL